MFLSTWLTQHLLSFLCPRPSCRLLTLPQPPRPLPEPVLSRATNQYLFLCFLWEPGRAPLRLTVCLCSTWVFLCVRFSVSAHMMNTITRTEALLMSPMFPYSRCPLGYLGETVCFGMSKNSICFLSLCIKRMLWGLLKVFSVVSLVHWCERGLLIICPSES